MVYLFKCLTITHDDSLIRASDFQEEFFLSQQWKTQKCLYRKFFLFVPFSKCQMSKHLPTQPRKWETQGDVKRKEQQWAVSLDGIRNVKWGKYLSTPLFHTCMIFSVTKQFKSWAVYRIGYGSDKTPGLLTWAATCNHEADCLEVWVKQNIFFS